MQNTLNGWQRCRKINVLTDLTHNRPELRPAPISVVIPAYNAGRYLSAALESVFAQTLPVAEIIVVDDGSTDNTAEVARSFPAQVRYHHQPQQGAAAARNQGVRLACGEWLALLDADDLWLPAKMALQMELFQQQPDLAMVFGRVEQFHSPDVTRPQAALSDATRVLDGYHPGTLLMRRTDFLRVGYFDPRWQAGEFIEWYARAEDYGLKSALLPQVVMQRRLHDHNLGLRLPDLARRDYLLLMKTIIARRHKKPAPVLQQ